MSHYRWFGVFINTSIIMGLIFIFSGCAKQPSKTAVVEQKQEVTAAQVKPVIDVQAPAEKKQEGQPLVIVKQEIVEKEAVVEKKEGAVAKEPEKKDVALRAQYIVKKGDCLWWTAKYKDVYNDSLMWSIIYEANKDKIKDPNLIYPGQQLNIPRKGYTLEKIKILRKKAGATKPYLPPKQANLPID
jgi:nucleoid-associated protein YgaU